MICPSCQSENDPAAASCARCGRGLGPLPPIEPGAIVASRYEILSQLGAGGMGMVFKAHDRKLDETVALKIVRASGKPDPEVARRFRSEVKLAWKVRHKNVCGVREYGEDGELLFFTMELVEGRDLKQLLRDRGGLTWEEAYDITVQVAAGLEAIHEAGIIHRDLKTANIMRDRHGVVRLMDFGIAKAGEPERGRTPLPTPVADSPESAGSERGSGITGTGQVVGSPEYMSPEQVQSRPIDFRSDVYALGVVIFEVFTGRVPFRGDTPAATMKKHVEEPPPLAGSEAAAIPEALLPVLRKALAKDAGERYASCRQMIVALERARAALGGRTQTVASAASGFPSTPARTDPEAASRGVPPPLPPEARLLVPTLARGLAHRDVGVRSRAAGMLARLGAHARAAMPALTVALEDESAAVRLAVVAALGAAGGAEAQAALLHAERDGEERVRAAASESLGRWAAERTPAEGAGAAPAGPSGPGPPPSSLALSDGLLDVAEGDSGASSTAPLELPPVPAERPAHGRSPGTREVRARFRLAILALLALLVVTAALWKFCERLPSGSPGVGARASL